MSFSHSLEWHYTLVCKGRHKPDYTCIYALLQVKASILSSNSCLQQEMVYTQRWNQEGGPAASYSSVKALPFPKNGKWWLQGCWPWVTPVHVNAHRKQAHWSTESLTLSYCVCKGIRAFQATWLQLFLDILLVPLTITMETSNPFHEYWKSMKAE